MTFFQGWSSFLLLQKCDTFCFSTCGGWPGHVDESIEQRASLLAALRALWPERSTKTHRVEYADHVVQNAPVVTGCQVVANFKFATNNG